MGFERERRGLRGPAARRLAVAYWVGTILLQTHCTTFDPPLDQSGVFAPCCAGQGVCAPAGLVEPNARAHLQVESCASELLCVPRPWATDPHFLPTSCTSIAGAEGRCVLECVAQGNGHKLPRDVCPLSEVCAPCFDPLTGADTSVCRIGADPGPRAAPTLSPTCCGDMGRCVARGLVEVTQQARLSADSCAGADMLCVPLAWASEPHFVAVSCESVAGSEGRCLPACLPEVAAQASRLPSAGCPAQHLCTPCFHPATGHATGACQIGADGGPLRTAPTVERCCEGLGVCAAAELLAAGERAQLGRESCAQPSALCIPESWAEQPQFIPPTCRSLAGLEGRCLPACLPGVAAQAQRLPQDTCAAGSLCTPCFDPVSAEDTKACRLGADPGPREPATTFEGCCSGLGRCVPSELVPKGQRTQLARDSCDQAQSLCLPSAWATSAELAPASCTSLAGREGRCVPRCLPGVARSPVPLPQASCPADHACAPCFDPAHGAATGACEIGGDPGPLAPAPPVQNCCAGVGRCIPSDFVPPDRRSRLARERCDDAAALCVPEAWALNQTFVPQTCRSLGDVEGRCLPSCLPELESRAQQLPEADCPAQHRCAPCVDPLSGAPTGACSLPGDPGPGETSQPFASCCDGAGRCVPSESVPPAERRRLAADECSHDGDLCAPATWVRDPGAAPLSCRSIGNSEGRCLPRCLPELAARAERLPAAGCPSAHVCAPCFDPVTSDATGACSIGGDPGPLEPARPLAGCCPDGAETLGVCVPSASLTADEMARLPRGSCSGNGALCAPKALVNSAAAALGHCQASSGVPGACIAQCFLSLVQGLVLARDSCRAGEACVPCDALGADAVSCQ